MRLHCSFTVACHLVFELTQLILVHFVRRGTAHSSMGMRPGWHWPRAATGSLSELRYFVSGEKKGWLLLSL